MVSNKKIYLFTLLQFLFFPQLAFGQVLDPDQYTSVTLLPRLSGALSLEARLEPNLTLTSSTKSTLGFGVAGGYNFLLDPHGEERIRVIADVAINESVSALGATTTFSKRAYNEHYAFASIGLSAMGRLLLDDEDGLGIEVGIGAETSLGSLFYDQPYLFGEFTSSVFLTLDSLNGAVSVYGRFGFRFDWAFRDSASSGRRKWE